MDVGLRGLRRRIPRCVLWLARYSGELLSVAYWHEGRWKPFYEIIRDEGIPLGTFREEDGRAVHLYADSEGWSWMLLCGIHGFVLLGRYPKAWPHHMDPCPPEEATCKNCLRIAEKASALAAEGKGG